MIINLRPEGREGAFQVRVKSREFQTEGTAAEKPRGRKAVDGLKGMREVWTMARKGESKFKMKGRTGLRSHLKEGGFYSTCDRSHRRVYSYVYSVSQSVVD